MHSATRVAVAFVNFVLAATEVFKAGQQQPQQQQQQQEQPSKKNVNVLLMLADDLGYADTSVAPFVGNGIKTPELERMASRGMVLTNFHTAATTCTPTRASILTGMYPWRMGIKAVFEYGVKTKAGDPKKSNRDDFLPQLPTMAMAFRDVNYSTGHSGKWHVGGMRNDDYDLRMLPVLQGAGDPRRGKEGGSGRRCPHPGPNQQGFDQYVSVLDGPGAPRQNDLQVNDQLYSKGCEVLLHNDKEIGRQGGSSTELLSDCEARHGIRMMREAVKRNQPFYVQVWFHAPHGPWEEVPGYKYPDPPKPPFEEQPLCSKNRTARYCLMGSGAGKGSKRSHDRGITRLDKYKTMVTAMDHAVGLLLRAVRDLGVERDTLVVFTSDNGPEDDAGTVRFEKDDEDNPWRGKWAGYTSAGYRGNKRHLYEGGVRVPTIAQWVGTIPKGSLSDVFAVSTDLFPTFFDAAAKALPANVYPDGMSIMPELAHRAAASPSSLSSSSSSSSSSRGGLSGALSSLLQPSPDTHAHGRYACTKAARRQFRRKIAERLTLWHNDWEGPKTTAGRLFDFKLILNGTNHPSELFDLRADVGERVNLMAPFLNLTTEEILSLRISPSGTGIRAPDPSSSSSFSLRSLVGAPGFASSSGSGSVVAEALSGSVASAVAAAEAAGGMGVPAALARGGLLQLLQSAHHRAHPALHLALVQRLQPILEAFHEHGDEAHVSYLARNSGRLYNETVESDTRHARSNIYAKIKKEKAAEIRAALLNGSCHRTKCSCDTPYAHQVPRFPFSVVPASRSFLIPAGFLNASAILTSRKAYTNTNRASKASKELATSAFLV
jgi:arylsulfatase A